MDLHARYGHSPNRDAMGEYGGGMYNEPRRGSPSKGPRDAGFLMKQNTLMKIGLAITLVILGLVVVVSMSIYEMRIERNTAANAARELRRMQRQGHEALAAREMKVQEALQEESTDLRRVEKSRADMGLLLSDYIIELDGILSKMPAETVVRKTVADDGKNFQRTMSHLFDELFVAYRDRREEAKKQMHQSIEHMQDYNTEESTQQAEYEAGEYGGEQYQDPNAPQSDDANTIHTNLQHFFNRYDEAIGHHGLNEERYNEMNAYWTSTIIPHLEVDEHGADTTKINEMKQKSIELIAAAGMPGYSGPNPDKGIEDELDWFQDVLEMARVKKHSTFIDDLRNKWAQGHIDDVRLTSELEKFSEENVDHSLPLHWLYTTA